MYTPRPLLSPFAPAVEQEFQLSYFGHIVQSLRVLSALLGTMFAAYAVRDLSDTRAPSLAFQQDGIPALFFFAVCALTGRHRFHPLWQPALVAAGLFVSAISLRAMALFLASFHGDLTSPARTFSNESLFFGQQVRVLMACLGLLRLQFKWALCLQLGALSVGVLTFARDLRAVTPSAIDLARFLQPTVAILVVVLLAAYVEEQLARRAFWAKHQLDIANQQLESANRQLEEERNTEKHKREQTEGKLQVLAQAIGGIVHDLGSPLTTVQLGAEILDQHLDKGADTATLHRFTAAIVDGVQLLNFLRLSLIEQTRVLEGRSIPVNARPVPLVAIVETGRRFQKPSAGTRAVELEGEEVWVLADEKKLVTVFMNLIGNALKYSDGDVAVSWRTFLREDNRLFVAVLDKGTAGCGITFEQARRLFTAFGRLDAHSQIEGTGLGLLSVQKIMEAHGGEAYIEGFEDGTPATIHFSTTDKDYPSLLEGDFRTAFVVTCPLAPKPDGEDSLVT